MFGGLSHHGRCFQGHIQVQLVGWGELPSRGCVKLHACQSGLLRRVDWLCAEPKKKVVWTIIIPAPTTRNCNSSTSSRRLRAGTKIKTRRVHTLAIEQHIRHVTAHLICTKSIFRHPLSHITHPQCQEHSSEPGKASPLRRGKRPLLKERARETRRNLESSLRSA